MTVVKAENVTFNPPPMPLYITLQVPVIDTFDTAEQKIVKLKEEIDELLNEACMGKIDEAAMMSELYDVVQVVAGYVVARLKEILVPEEAYKMAPDILVGYSVLHHEKMDAYSEERGWMVVHK